MLILLSLFGFLSSSSAALLNLYAGWPTYPADIQSSPCCLPQGLVTFEVLGQIESYDYVSIQADEWVGLICPNNTSGFSIEALSYNQTDIDGNIVSRNLISPSPPVLCQTYLYEFNPEPQYLYAGGPTIPADISNSDCCLPQGSITFLGLSQVILFSELVDCAYLQADEWIGGGCAINNITNDLTVQVVTRNETQSLYVGNTLRILSTFATKAIVCNTILYDSDPNVPEWSNILSDILTGMSIVACLWFFYRYYKVPRKPYGLHLIFILSIADFFYTLTQWIMSHLDPVLSDPTTTSPFTMPLGYSMNFMLYFTVFWSTTMSIVLMKVLTNMGMLSNTAKTWILLLLPSLVIAACVTVIEEVLLLGLNIYWSVGLYGIPIGITIGCYARTIRVLRKNPTGIKFKDHILFLYPAVQLFLGIATTFPSVVFSDPNLTVHEKLVDKQILGLPECMLGLANAAIYLLQKRKKVVKIQLKEDSSNDSLLREYR